MALIIFTVNSQFTERSLGPVSQVLRFVIKPLINTGAIVSEHWQQNPNKGGTRVSLTPCYSSCKAQPRRKSARDIAAHPSQK